MGQKQVTLASYLAFRVTAAQLCDLFIQEEILPHEGGEALAQAAQRSCGCPLPGRVQGQVGRSSEHPGLGKGVPARGRAVEQDGL